MSTIVAIVIILHGLVHGILAAAPNPNSPEEGAARFFSGGKGSWLFNRLGFSAPVSQIIATIMAAIAMIGFIAAGLALLDILVPFDWWRTLAIGSAVVSLLLLIIYWNTYLIVGILIDVAILVVLLFTNWSPE